ncbi:MAG: PAS domain S-box protein [Mariniphaga sp.]
MENKKLKILAIDDNADNLLILKALIKDVFTDAVVLTELDGETGIKTAIAEDPDVILLDIMMPEMDGYEVCSKLKSHDKLVDIPVVFVTALKGDKESRLRVLEAGAEAFLSKPVDEVELIAQIRAMHAIKTGRVEKRNREELLVRLVGEQTRELKMTQTATLELLEDLKKEVEARKKSESALRESEQRYRSFIENSMDAILLTQPDGNILSANTAACEMFDMTETELKNTGRAGIVDQSDNRLMNLIEQREKNGKAKGELRLRRKNGEMFTAEISSALFKNSSGEVFSSMIIRDITQRLEAEKTIDNERLLLRTLINNIPDSIYSKDLLCRKTLANTMEMRYMGAKSEAEVLGKNDFDVYPQEMAARFYADDRYVLETGKPVLNREELFLSRQGEKKWLLSSKLPLRDRSGQITGLVGIGKDITDLKRRELVQTMQYNMATAMVNRKSLQELFDGIRADLNQLMEAENLTLVMLNPEAGMLYSPVDFEAEGENPQTWPAGGSLTGWLISQRKSRVFSHSELEELAAKEKLVRYGPKSECWMGVPLFDEEKACGAIILQSYKNRDAYDAGSVRIIEVVASQLSSYMKRLNAEETALKLSKAVEQSPDTIFITNKKGIIEYVNPKFTAHTGYTAEDVIGKTPRILNSGKHSKAFYKTLWDTLLAGRDWHGEMFNRRKDGACYWENATISPICNNEGEITHYIAIKEDITDKKKTEEALKHHSALQAMLIKIASGYINVNLANLDSTIEASLAEMGKFAAADRAYIFEYDWDRNTTTNTYEWCEKGISPQINNLQEIPVKLLDRFVEAHEKGEALFVADVQSLSEDDPLKKILEPQEIRSTITLPMMEGTKCTGFVGFDWVREIHEYLEGEKVLLNIFAQLLVNVHLKISLEKKLIIEKEKAEAADKLKTAFLNNISHEVRTPLNGILGFGNILMQEYVSPEEKEEYYQVLQESSNRLVHTITSYMDISLITSGNMPVNKKKFSLHNLLYNLYKVYQKEHKWQNLELSLELNGYKDDLHFESDQELIKKVLMHLLDNAIKFTPSGNIRFGYTFKGSNLEFFVNDTGPGIEPAMVDKVFDNFVQEDSGLSRGYEGSGLGLSISKGLVELLGGTISVSSERGNGTSVRFLIPTSEKSADQLAAAKHSSSEGEPLILIAEDDVVNQFYLKTILKMGNFECITVKNGKLAVEECRRNTRIKLVLMDMKMPLMGGLEATRQIKQLRPELPVVAVTALATVGDDEMAREAGCDDYLAKPFKKEVLLEKAGYYLNSLFTGESGTTDLNINGSSDNE